MSVEDVLWQLHEEAARDEGLSRAQLLRLLRHERSRFDCLWRESSRLRKRHPWINVGGDAEEAREYVDGVLRGEWE